MPILNQLRAREEFLDEVEEFERNTSGDKTRYFARNRHLHYSPPFHLSPKLKLNDLIEFIFNFCHGHTTPYHHHNNNDKGKQRSFKNKTKNKTPNTINSIRLAEEYKFRIKAARQLLQMDEQAVTLCQQFKADTGRDFEVDGVKYLDMIVSHANVLSFVFFFLMLVFVVIVAFHTFFSGLFQGGKERGGYIYIFYFIF